MSRVFVVCEGATEEAFVNELLKPHFYPREVYLKPIQLNGGTSYDKLRDAIRRQSLKEPQAWITTFVDLYGMNGKYPGYKESAALQPVSRAEKIEEMIHKDLAGNLSSPERFIPYVQLHEFEALLYSEAGILEDALQMNKKFKKGTFVGIREKFASPEHINDDPKTSPSHRIAEVMGNSYQKNVDGILIALEIGLDRMRKECAHFDAWLGKLEVLI